MLDGPVVRCRVTGEPEPRGRRDEGQERDTVCRCVFIVTAIGTDAPEPVPQERQVVEPLAVSRRDDRLASGLGDLSEAAAVASHAPNLRTAAPIRRKIDRRTVRRPGRTCILALFFRELTDWATACRHHEDVG